MTETTKEADGGRQMNTENQGFAGIDFIDPFFAVVLSISFSQIMHELWFNDPSILLDSPYNFQILVLALGYLTVLLSWVFYHLSLSTTRETKFWRFICDVAMLSAYFLLLVKFENFALTLTLLFVIFVLYFFWDQFRLAEYRTDMLEDAQVLRRGVTVLWMIAFVFLMTLYWLYGELGTIQDPGWREWTFLGFAIGCIIGYRLHKMTPRGQLFLNCLGKIDLHLPG